MNIRRLISLTLALLLTWCTVAGAATSLQYVLPGTPVVFADSGGTVTWTLSNRGAGTGQYSALHNKGTGPQPALWEARCQISLTGTLTLGAPLEFYLIRSDGTTGDGGVGTTTNTFTSDQRRVFTLIGVLPVYQTTQNTTMYATFTNIAIPNQYFQLGFWNGSAISTETSTTKHRCSMTPIPPQMQAS